MQLQFCEVLYLLDFLCYNLFTFDNFVGAHLYAPGVLSMETNTNLNDCVNVFADMDGTCKRGTTTFESPNKRLIATGTVLMQRHQLFRNNISPR